MFEILSHLEKFHIFHATRVNSPRFNKSENTVHAAREMIEIEVEIMQAFFESTGNPLYALRALKCCVDGKLQPPVWVEAYLQRSVIGLLKETEKEQHEPTGDVLTRCFRFDGSKGRGNWFSQYAEQKKRFKALVEVYRKRFETDGATFEDIRADLSVDLGIPESTLKRWKDSLSRAGKKFEKISNS